MKFAFLFPQFVRDMLVLPGCAWWPFVSVCFGLEAQMFTSTSFVWDTGRRSKLHNAPWKAVEAAQLRPRDEANW
jgi:hypothetical protein